MINRNAAAAYGVDKFFGEVVRLLAVFQTHRYLEGRQKLDVGVIEKLFAYSRSSLVVRGRARPPNGWKMAKLFPRERAPVKLYEWR
jgi:hypothetical protein